MRQIVRTAVGVAILIDVLSVFLPSLITIFGRAGDTPAELIGLYALSWFLGAFVAVGVARWVGPRGVGLAGAVLLVAGRLILQFTDGGFVQLYVASASVLAGLAWLVATAIETVDARPFMRGLVWGLAGATGLHAALDTVDLMWRGGVLPVILVIIELAAFVLLLQRGPRPLAPLLGSPLTTSGAPRAWLTVGPAVLLWGLYTGNSAHAGASSGWSAASGAIAVSVAALLATAVVAQPRRWTGHPAIPAAVLVVTAAAFAFGAVTVDGVHGVSPWWTVPAQLLGALALAGCLGWAATTESQGPAVEAPPRAPHPYRRGLALAGGFVLLVILLFAYYAAYDLGVTNDYVPLVLALVVGGLAVAGASRRAAEPLGTQPLVGAAIASVVVVLAIVAAPLWRASGSPPEPAATGLRVAAYNIRMGFGLSGRLNVIEQADALRALNAQVIVMSEIDRAWMLNGGHDDLRLIAQRLGLEFVWAPAADEMWGDALLTNLPITSVRNHVLPQGGPTGAQALEVGLRWDDSDLTVIATHLQPPKNWEPLDQVQALADIVRAAPKPAIVAGDLNLRPGDPAWDALLAAGLTDALADARPVNTIPTPGDAQQIDHILFTGGFSASDPANPDLPWSDHRPIAVTLTPA
jgi:endonuclease/exonuclease/phosphatase family metal-dependent hydrolase